MKKNTKYSTKMYMKEKQRGKLENAYTLEMKNMVSNPIHTIYLLYDPGKFT